MKRITVAFIIILSLVLIFSACNGGDEIEETELLEYDIVIDETVDVYIWEDVYRIEPKLMDNHGRVVESRFDYQISSSDIEISYDGYITIKNTPKEPISVTISERNTGTQKTIALNFVSDVTNVKAIADLNGARVERMEDLVLTEDIVLSVISDQRNINIKDFLTIKVTDPSGNEKNVFDISFDKSNVTFKPIGIGDGEIYFEVVNGAGEKLYSSTVPFSISMKDSALSDAILAREKKALLSREELEAVDDIVIGSSVKSLSETRYMSSLDTVIIDGNEMLVFENAPEDCYYRVKDLLYIKYYASSEYSEFKDNIIPYKYSYDERYAIYHSSRGEELSFSLIDNSLKFPTKTTAGYTNVGWEDAVSKVTENDVKGMEKEIVHLYAVWEAKENQLIFDGNGCTYGQMNNQIIRSDASANLSKNIFLKAGYTFKGWSTTSDGSAMYKDGAVYTMGLDESYTLYAVWEANINTLKFLSNGGDGVMPDLRIATDSQSVLNKNLFQRKGYEFIGWSEDADGEAVYDDESVYKMGVNESYELYAIWSPIEYTITYDLDGGTAGKNTLDKYTIENDGFRLSYPVKSNYYFMGWIGEGIEQPQRDVYIKPSANNLGNLEYTAVWGATVMFLPNGAQGEPAEQIIQNNTSNYYLMRNSFKKDGHVFLGWSTRPDGDVEYEDASLYNCGGDGEYRLYAIWHEGTPGLKYAGTASYEVTSYTGSYTDIMIPARYNGVWVTGISDSVFKNNTDITSIEIPSGVVNYNVGVLAGCSNLKSIEFAPLEGTTLGTYFGNSSYNGSVAVSQKNNDVQKTYYIPSNLTQATVVGYQVTDGCFENCSTLRSVVLEAGVEKIGKRAFAYCNNLRTVVIPEGVKVIDDYAFAGCSHLETVVLPESLEYIGKNAFADCTNLDNIVIHSNLTSIPEYAFADCRNLQFIVVSDSVESIGAYAFKNCTNLKGFIIPRSIATVDTCAFVGCTGIESITIEGNAQFSENAFSGCTNLKSVTISDSVTEFDVSAFKSLKNNVFTVYNGALYVGSMSNPYRILVGVANKSIEKCVIAEGAKIINTGAFADCSNLNEITIPASVSIIKEGAFAFCTGLKAVNITDVDAWCRIKYVNNSNAENAIMNPLYYAHSLYVNGVAVSNVTIPNDLIHINEYIFQGCTTLENVTIPNSIQSIGGSAFMGCSSLKKITISKNVTEIGAYAFSGCATGLKEVVFEENSGWNVTKKGSSKNVEWTSAEEAATLLTQNYSSYKWYK